MTKNPKASVLPTTPQRPTQYNSRSNTVQQLLCTKVALTQISLLQKIFFSTISSTTVTLTLINIFNSFSSQFQLFNSILYERQRFFFHVHSISLFIYKYCLAQYIHCGQHIQVHTDERTQVHSTWSSHQSTNQG